MCEKKLIEETDKDKTYEGNKEGVCPNCGSEKLMWDNREQIDCDCVRYEGHCENCGAMIIETYKLVFEKTLAIVDK